MRASAARCIADQKEKRRQVAQLAELQDSWTERAELALTKGRDDLARLALIEKEKLDRPRRASWTRRSPTIDQALRALEADIAKLQAKLREARIRQNALATRIETAHNQVRMREMYAGEPDRGGLLQLRPARARGRSCRRARPTRCCSPRRRRTLEEEIAELKVAERVDAELEAMKAARRIAA